MLRHIASRNAFTLLVASIALLSLSGCGRVTGTTGISQKSMSFSGSAEGVPGIEEGTIDVITLFCGPPQGVTMIFWSDLSRGTSGSGGTSGQPGRRTASYHGSLRGEDDQQVEIHAETSDGVNCAVTIAGQTFEIHDQADPLFLISTQDGKVAVKQLAFDLSQLPQETEQFKQLGQSDQRIISFFQTARPGESISSLPAEADAATPPSTHD